MQVKKMVLTGITVATVFFAGIVIGAQPHMESALRSLHDAKTELQLAEPNKGGHRAKAIELIDAAIFEVQAGIDFAAGALPPIEFAAPPEVIAIPDTDGVYAVPDIDADLYFWDGWWWRQWEGRWYRSNYYNRDWGYYDHVPSFYFDVDPGWRRYYRDHNWYGHRWDHERISHQQLQQNWRDWQDNRHWERQGNWGVRDYQPRPKHEMQELRHQREEEYQKRPEVQQHQQQKQPQEKQQDKQQKKQDGQQQKQEQMKEQKQEKQQDKQQQDKKQQQHQKKQEGTEDEDKGPDDKDQR